MPTNYAVEFAIGTNFINKVQDKAYLGNDNEDLYAHLLTYDALCGTFKLKDMSREFVLLNFFWWSLNDKAKCFEGLLHHCITS